MNSTEINKVAFLERGGLNFTVSKQKMFTEASDLQGYDDTPFYTTLRNDTRTPLGCVTDRYVVKQNNDLLDVILEKIGDERYDLSKSKCGMFRGGRKVFLLGNLSVVILWSSDQPGL